MRTLSVSGNGQAYLAPDIAYIYLGVHTENQTAAEAVAENTTQTQTVIKAITDFGIDAEGYPHDEFQHLAPGQI